MPGMNMDHGHSGSFTVDNLALVLRLLLLLSTATLAGTGLARPLVRVPGPRLAGIAWIAAVVVAAASLASLLLPHISAPFTILQIVLALAVPPLLRWPKIAAWDSAALVVLLLAETALSHNGLLFLVDLAYVLSTVAFLGSTVAYLTGSEVRPDTRLKPVAVTSALVLLAAGIGELALSGVGLDRRLYQSGYGLVLVALIALPIVTALALRAPRVRAAHAVGAAAVALTFLGWTSLPALPQPPELPTPGVPLLAQADLAGQATPLLLSPQRPGHNLVHFPDSAGKDLSVRTPDGQEAKALPRPGAEGTWADLDLPAGRSDLTVQRGHSMSTVSVDVGSESGVVNAVGPDAPECASAALGGLVSGARTPLARCPADSLAPPDADALRKLVSYAASRATPGITLAEDGSPRSRQAADVVRTSAAQAHIPTTSAPDPHNALVVVSGWSDASQRLQSVSYRQADQQTYGSGVFLAPWLLHTPVVNRALTSFLPLRFNPRDEQALTYSVAAENSFGGEAPSTSGFDQWLSARRETPHEALALYASAQVSAMPMDTMGSMEGMDMGGDYPGQWVSGGTVVPVSGPLSP